MIVFFLLAFNFPLLTRADAVCGAPIDAGSLSCSNSSLRYHFDPATKRCLAFKFTGCGGNENNFDSVRTCRQRCLPQDHLTCPANTGALKNDKGTTNCGVEKAAPKCTDSGSYCHSGGHGVGLCCSKAEKEKVHQDHKKTCSNGKEKYHYKSTGGHDHTLLAKSCSTEFCPSGYQCQTGNYYAFCCKK